MLDDYKRLKNKLPQAMYNAVERLSKETVEEINSDDENYTVEKKTTEIIGSKVSGGYRTTDMIDLYKEFGTGYVGSKTPSISPFFKEAGWQYWDASISKNPANGVPIEEGWVYEKNGQYYHTYGQVGKNVFTDATLKMEDRVNQVLSEEIEKILDGGN